MALDIICRPWAAPPKSHEEDFDHESGPSRVKYSEDESQRQDELGIDSLPSWIPSIEGAAYGLEPESKCMVRKNADTLVDLPGDRKYTAAGGEEELVILCPRRHSAQSISAFGWCPLPQHVCGRFRG